MSECNGIDRDGVEVRSSGRSVGRPRHSCFDLTTVQPPSAAPPRVAPQLKTGPTFYVLKAVPRYGPRPLLPTINNPFSRNTIIVRASGASRLARSIHVTFFLKTFYVYYRHRILIIKRGVLNIFFFFYASSSLRKFNVSEN